MCSSDLDGSDASGGGSGSVSGFWTRVQNILLTLCHLSTIDGHYLVMMTVREIDEKAVRVAGEFLSREAELIDVLVLVLRSRAWEKLGFGSAWEYAVRRLGFTDDLAYRYVNVAQAAIKVPELKQAIDKGDVSASNARRIARVITPQTSSEWIEKAATMSTHRLEREVVKVSPREKVR